MNKVVLTLLGILVVGLGAVIVVQQQTTSLLHRKHQLLEEEKKNLRDQLAALQKEIEEIRAQEEKLAVGAPVEKAAPASSDSFDATTNAATPAQPGQGGNEMLKGIAKMFTDPEMKKVMRSQQAMGLRMIYGDLAKELGLTPDEADQVMNLLTDRQMALTSEGMKLLSGEGDATVDLAKQGKAVEAAKEEWDKQLKGILGEDRYSKFEDYEKSMGDRMLLTQLKSQLSATGMALSDEQSSGILQIMKEEREKLPPHVFDTPNQNVAAQISAIADEANIEEFMQRQTELHRRIVDRSHTVLSPDQVLQFRKSMDEIAQMQQMGIKMGRQMFGGGNKGGGQSAPAPAELK